MSRYAVSGSNTSAITAATASTFYNVLGKDITSGRVFWLRCIWYGSSGTDGDLLLYDVSQGNEATDGTKVAVLPSYLSAIHSGIQRPGYFEWAPPGLKFATGCCVELAVSGSIAIGKVGGNGYEE